jgi:hypothetical protein
MLDFKNIILILIILFLLNYLKCETITKVKPSNKKNKNISKKHISIEKMTQFIPDKDLLFGKDQFILKSDLDKKFYYQDLDILKQSNLLELSSNLRFKYDTNNDMHITNINNYDNRNLANKLQDKKLIKNPISNEQIIKNFNKQTQNAIINTPIYETEYPVGFVSSKINIEEPVEQKMLYDYRFLDMNKDKLENLIHNDNLDNKFNEGKTIKEVYDSLIFDYKKINQKKNSINKNINTDGAFGESALPVDQWYYDGEINELSFDPSQSLELAVPLQEDISDDY